MKTKQVKSIVTQLSINKQSHHIDENRNILKGFLSPLETEAQKYYYKPFTYQIEGISYYINQKECNKLFQLYIYKINMIKRVIQDTSNALLGGNQKLNKFLSSEISAHQLPSYLVNCLYRKDCRQIIDVLLLGSQIHQLQCGIGKKGIETLKCLFEKHNCTHLFRE
jgi:hypothetical protein